MKKLIPLWFFFLGAGLWAQPEPFDLPSALARYGFKLPAGMSVPRVERLLTQFANATHGRAFRYLGVMEDFFHGHILFESVIVEGETRLYPRAILYHTQEEAHAVHWERRYDARYDYLNVTTRNWIQWLSADEVRDGVRIVNAREYLDPTQRDPAQFQDETAAPRQDLHYTIHSRNLDPAKLGFRPYGDLQFEFYEDGCDGPRNDYYGTRRGPVRVRIGRGEVVCLSLSTANPLLDLPIR